MTLTLRSLHPELLDAFEPITRCRAQLAEVGETAVGQDMRLEPCPQVFHRIEVRRVRLQEHDLDMDTQTAKVVVPQPTAVRLQDVPNDKHWLLQA